MNRAEIAREKLSANLKVLMHDVEELIKATAEQTGEGLASLRESAAQKIGAARGTLPNGKKVLETSKHGAESAICYAQENPRITAGVAAGAAIAIAFLLWARSLR